MSKKDVSILGNINYKTGPFHEGNLKNQITTKVNMTLKPMLFALGKRYSYSSILEIFFY